MSKKSETKTATTAADAQHFKNVAADMMRTINGQLYGKKPGTKTAVVSTENTVATPTMDINALAKEHRFSIHAAAAVFPMMPDDELQALADDIKAHGLTHRIVVDGRFILDGRNRLAACSLAAVTPEFVEHKPDDVVAYIIGANIHRRHLTTAQRAAIAADLATLERGTNRYEQKVDGSNDPSTSDAPPTIEEAAKLMNVSTATVKRAKATKKKDPAAHADAKAGKTTKRNRRRLGDGDPKPSKSSKVSKSIVPGQSFDPRAPADVIGTAIANTFSAADTEKQKAATVRSSMPSSASSSETTNTKSTLVLDLKSEPADDDGFAELVLAWESATDHAKAVFLGDPIVTEWLKEQRLSIASTEVRQ